MLKRTASVLTILFSFLLFSQCERNSLRTNAFDPISLIGINLASWTGAMPQVTLQAEGLYYANAATYSFGTVTVGSSSPGVLFTLQNNGADDVILSGVPVVAVGGDDAADFTATDTGATVLAPGGSADFTVRFAPAMEGTRDGIIRIMSNDGSSTLYTLNLTGVGSLTPVPGIHVSVGTTGYAAGSTFSYGNVPQGGTSGAVTFTIENAGIGVLNLGSVTISGPNAADFTVAGPGSATVAAGGSETFTVTFTPSGSGTETAVLTIVSDDPDVGTYTINLVGTGIPGPVPVLTAVSISSSNLNPAYAMAGDVVTLSLTANMPIQSPTVTIAGGATVLSGGPTAWTATYTMLAGDAEGTVPFYITNIMDLGANPGPDVLATTDGSAVTFDRTAPTGYSVSINQAYINSTNATGLSFAFAGAEVGARYDYSVTDMTSSTVTGSGTVTAAGETIGGINVSGLGDGTLTLSVTLTDAAGNAGATVMDTVDKDTVLPNVSITAPSAGASVNGAAFISFTTDGPAPQVSVDNTNWIVAMTGMTQIYNMSQFTGVAEGVVFPLYLRDTDAAGNVGTDTISLTKDTVAPTVAIGAPSNTLINSTGSTAFTLAYEVAPSPDLTGGDITLNETGVTCTTVNVTNGGTVNPSVTVSGCSGNGSFTISVAAGRSADAAGNTDIGAGPGAAVTVDNTNPTVGFTSTPTINSSNASGYIVSGTCTENGLPVTVTVDGSVNDSPNCVLGAFTTAPMDVSGVLNGASVNVVASQTDAAGNSGIDSTTVVKDTVAPSITSAVTQDFDNDGRIDRYLITFDNPVNDSTFNVGNWTVAGHTITGWDTVTANDSQISLIFQEMTFPDTGAIPDLTVTADGIRDMVGNPINVRNTNDTPNEKDGARPRIESVVGAVGSDRVMVTFSEPVDSTSGMSCGGTMPNLVYSNTSAGGATAFVSWQDPNACDDATVVFRTDAAVLAADIDADTVMPPASTIYDNSDNTAMPNVYAMHGLINSIRFLFDTTSAGANVTVDVSNFPLLLRINNPTIIDATRPGGDDIRFYDSDTGDMIPFQIERWDQANDAAEVWVLVPTVSGNSSADYITMYYNDQTDGTVPGMSEPARVFGTGNQFAGVWHMAQPTGTTAYDSTANKNNSSINTTTQQYWGLVGPSQQFNGSTYIEFEDTAINNGDALDGTSAGGLMLSAWVKPDDGGFGTLQSIIAKQASTFVNDGYQLLTQTSTENITYRAYGSYSINDTLAANTIQTDWYYFSVYLDSSTNAGTIYFNGVDTGASVSGTPHVVANETAVTLGRQLDGTYPFTGYMDEVRIENTNRGADWVKLCYENQRQDQTLVRAWYNTAWPYRIKITVPAAQVSGMVNDFPVYIDLANLPTSFWTNVISAADIMITAGDGFTKLPREVVSFTDAGASGTGELWFRAPRLSNANINYFYIYYGNGSGSETNSADVWSNGYVGVWHLEDATYSDSSPTPATGGSGTGGIPFFSGGGFGFGKYVDLDGTTAYITVPNAAKLQNLAGTATASLWIKPKSVTGTRYLLSKNYTSMGFDLVLGTTFYYPYVNAAGPFSVDASLAMDTTYYHAVTFDGTAGRVYNNGVLILTPTIPSLLGNTGVLVIGRSSSGGGFYYGYIDEIHLSNVARSPEWISTEYNNQSAPLSFCTFGAQETP